MSSNKKRTRRFGENALATYFREINKVPLLSRTEEEELAQRAKRGDSLAREKIIQANLRFVVNVAKRFRAPGFPLEDLVSEGNIGLILALEHYDPEKGYRFISYAVWWIRQTILKAIGEKSRMIRLPQNKAEELMQIMRAREELQSRELKAGSEADAIAARLRIDRDSVAELLNISRELLSLQAPVCFDDDLSLLEDFVEDKNSRRPEEILMEGSLRDDVNSVLVTLSRRESEILQSRFGLNGKGPSTLKAIGSNFNLSKERVRQIERKAIGHLRQPSLNRPLRAYL